MSALPSSQLTPQAQKDALLQFSDTSQEAFAGTAQKLQQLGSPGITSGKRVQDTAVGFFTSAAGEVGVQRAKLAALDANDPDFAQKVAAIGGSGSDLGAASAEMQALVGNKELAPAFGGAPECQRLVALTAHR